MSDDLVVFLRERLDEDERSARRADEGPWRLKTLGRHDQAAISTNATTGLVQLDGGPATANGVHIARHDPARTLREAEAKRRLLRHYESAVIALRNAGPSGEIHDQMTSVVNTLRAVLRDQAQVYADHPDCKETWRP